MDIFVPQIKFLFHLPLFLKLQVTLYRTTTELCSVWFGVHSSKNKPFNNKSHWMVYKIWAGVDSNHRRLASTDLQSVAFSHSATDPYLICLWRDLNSWPLPYQGSALPLRHKGISQKLLTPFGVLPLTKNTQSFVRQSPCATKANATRAMRKVFSFI